MPGDLEQLASSPGGLALAILLGLLWGSFANVCIYRWPPSDDHPKGRSVVTPGSHCFACKAPIRWYDNVPLLSYLWLRGRCRACKAAFSPRYLIVEALTGALFGVAWWFTFGTGGFLEASASARAIHFAIDAAFVWVMVVIAFIDLDTMHIYNKVTAPAMVIAYAASLYDRAWWEGLLGIAIGYGVPWLIGEIYIRLRGREGLGMGDAMMLGMVGGLLGWRGVVATLFGGSMVGAVIGIVALLVARRHAEGEQASLMKTELPFGPFLALAAVFYLFAEPWILVHFRFATG